MCNNKNSNYYYANYLIFYFRIQLAALSANEELECGRSLSVATLESGACHLAAVNTKDESC